MNRCLSIDWVTILVKMPRKDYETYHSPYTIRKDKHNTRHFRQIHYIYTPAGDEVGYVAHDPHSEILSADSGLLKLNNKYLYQQNLKEWIVQLLSDLGMKFVSFSRIDLALDFERFNNNLSPENFIKGLFTGKYVKRGKTQFQNLGNMGGVKGVRNETIKFGSNDSDIQYYLYNKSKEMADVKHKQWIADNWAANGHDGVTNVWRLEFRIKKSNKGVYQTDTETGELKLIFDMTDINCMDNIDALYKYLFTKHFSFVHNQKKSRLDRCKPLKLFSENMALHGVAIRLSDKKESDRSARIMAKHLQKLEYEMRGLDFNLALFTHELTGYFIMSRGLKQWAEDKLKYVVSPQQQTIYNSRTVSIMKNDKTFTHDEKGKKHNIVELLKEMYGNDGYMDMLRAVRARKC